MNSGLQLIGMLVALCGGICTLVATFLPEWKRNDPKDDLIEAIIRHQGIWIRCISYSTGLWQCDDYDALIIGLPREIQIARWSSILAVMIGCIAYLLSIVGMECTRFVDANPTLKRRVALVAAVCWMLSGIMMGVAASTFSHEVVNDYFALGALGVNAISSRWIFGPALFVGWAAMVLSIIGGIVMGCGSFSENSAAYRYQHNSVRQVGRLGRNFTQSFRRGRDSSPLTKKRAYDEYV